MKVSYGMAAKLALGLLLTSCEKVEVVTPPPPLVQVMEIVPSEVSLAATLIGQLDSPQNVEIRARVEAFVEDAPFQEGKEVEKDQVIFQLDKKPYEKRLQAAEGALAEAKAALAKYRADVARLAPLFEKRAIPKQDLDNAMAAVEVGEASVESVLAQVDSAKLDLGYCTVRAPITGLIGAKQVSIGNLVGKGEPTLMATISSQDKIWFYCNISEVDFLKAESKSDAHGKSLETLPLTLILSNGTEHPETGKLVFVDRAVDAKTGTLRLRAEFANPKKNLRPGMFARARIDLGTRKDCLEVPERAVVELQGKTFLWFVGDDGLANQREVTVGEQNGAKLLVVQGLKVGDRVIVEGLQKAREGAPVTAMTAAQLAALQSASPTGAKPAKH
jgi:membrane fusion protein (multidrug efflux system)